MIIIALIIGGILIVAALRNTQGVLASALMTDVPAFIVWAAAIAAIGAIGFIPGLKPTSRVLLALVILVIVLKNYQAILSGFQNAWQNPPAATGATSSSSGSGSGGSGGVTSLLGSAADNAIAGAVQSGLPNFIGAL